MLNKRIYSNNYDLRQVLPLHRMLSYGMGQDVKKERCAHIFYSTHAYSLMNKLSARYYSY